MKVGLLGGSFNPAHQGHLHISNLALHKLKLAQVWWLVSPHNPLKEKNGMADFATRLEKAKTLAADNPKIKVLDIEAEMGTVYTVDTLKRLKKRFPRLQFVWLMGADNLIQLPKWKNWQQIPKLVPVHVFDRADFFHEAVNSPAYSKYRGRVFYHKTRKNPLSATSLRAKF